MATIDIPGTGSDALRMQRQADAKTSERQAKRTDD
jgi:hypothetical protein